MSDTVRHVRATQRDMDQTKAKEVPFSAIYCRAFNTAAILVANNTNTALTFDSETYDTAAFHSASVNTGRLTFPYLGNYLVTGHVEFASNAVGYRQVFIRRNGTDAIAVLVTPAVNGAVTVLSIAVAFLFAAGDYVELVVTQTSGGNLNVDAANYYTPYFGATRLP